MNKGVVMEINDKSIIVLTPSGSFERIPSKNRSCQVGEEIVFSPKASGLRQPAWAAMSVFVAAVLLCVVLFAGLPAVFADRSVVAYVTIDINPSVELGIDKREKVREMRGLNDKGLEAVRSISYSGKSLDEVTDKLLQKVEEMKVFDSGEADIIVASTKVKDSAALADTTVSEQVKQQVLSFVAAKHSDKAQKFEVTAFSAPSEVRDAAKETGLSLGKYSVYLSAKSQGNDVKVDELKEDSVHVLAKEAGGLDKLVDTTKLNKDSIKELLHEEKNGSLDKKVQQKKQEDDKKSSAKPTGKATSTPSKSSAPTSTKQASPTPAVKSTVKPGEGTKASDNKNDDAKSEEKTTGKDDKSNDKKEDKTVKSGQSSSPSSNSGNGKDDKSKQDPKSTPTPAKEEDRKTSGSSSDSKDNASNIGKSDKENKKEDKNEDKNEDKKDK